MVMVPEEEGSLATWATIPQHSALILSWISLQQSWEDVHAISPATRRSMQPPFPRQCGRRNSTRSEHLQYICVILPWTCQRILSDDYGFTTTEETTTTTTTTTTTKGARSNEQKTTAEPNTKTGLPKPPEPKLGENLLQINVYLDTLSEQIIATTATYSMVIYCQAWVQVPLSHFTPKSNKIPKTEKEREIWTTGWH